MELAQPNFSKKFLSCHDFPGCFVARDDPKLNRFGHPDTPEALRKSISMVPRLILVQGHRLYGHYDILSQRLGAKACVSPVRSLLT